MKFLKLFQKKNKREARRIGDFYQDSIEKNGRDQIQKLVDKGLNFPIFLM